MSTGSRRRSDPRTEELFDAAPQVLREDGIPPGPPPKRSPGWRMSRTASSCCGRKPLWEERPRPSLRGRRRAPSWRRASREPERERPRSETSTSSRRASDGTADETREDRVRDERCACAPRSACIARESPASLRGRFWAQLREEERLAAAPGDEPDEAREEERDEPEGAADRARSEEPALRELRR